MNTARLLRTKVLGKGCTDKVRVQLNQLCIFGSPSKKLRHLREAYFGNRYNEV